MDLGRLTFLTVVGTQGRYARSSGNEFARAYRLNYSRDGLLWKSWRNRLGNAVSGPNIGTVDVNPDKEGKENRSCGKNGRDSAEEMR